MQRVWQASLLGTSWLYPGTQPRNRQQQVKLDNTINPFDPMHDKMSSWLVPFQLHRDFLILLDNTFDLFVMEKSW